MLSNLAAEMAAETVDERVAAAERFRRQRKARLAVSRPDGYEAVTVRLARAGDEAALRALAQRDGRPEPHAPVLVAEAEGALLAARSLADGRSVADPFRHSAHLRELLALRAAHLRSDGQAPTRGVRKRLAAATGRLGRHIAATPHRGR
jgi:hypothetical protein